MKITKDENMVLFQELFRNEANYNKFAPYISEFIKEYAGWLKSKGLVVQLT